MNALCLHRWTAGLAAAVLGSTGLAQQESDLVVRLTPGSDVADLCARFDATLVSAMPERGLYRIRVAPELPGELVCFFMEDDPIVEAVEPDEVAVVVGGHTQSFFVRTNANYTQQPALALLGAFDGVSGPDGGGVIVAVLDTGISANTAISAAILPGYNFIDHSPDTNDIGNANDTNNNGELDELTGHGTFIAGLISVVAPHCNLLPVKVLDSDGQGSVFTVAAGIYYAVDHGAKVINLSLSFTVESTTVADAIEYAQQHGVLLVASVGNNNSTVAAFPAASPGVIAVAATTMRDFKADFSDYGTYVDLCAPGVNVVSTLPNDMLGVGSGASCATAWVSGAAALLQSSMPNPTVERITTRLRRSALRVPATLTQYPGQMGTGRLSIGNAFSTFSARTAQEDK